ncbi:MAG: lipid II flippase MurJ [Candidatus Pacebacteria bacterium]|nr:lipid II flippase MurJ [Candidatus Paceibacterota bacterium]
MVKNILRFIHREITGLHQAAYLLGIFAFLSQVLALFRDRLFAYSFGASHSLDLYYVSFRIPDFIFASVASVVSISVIIPFLVERMQRGEAEGKKFIDAVFSAFFIFIVSISVIVYALIPYFIHIFFPSFDGADTAKLITMTRIVLLSPIFLGISNFFASITQVHKRFFLYAISPLFYNIGIILGVIFLYPMFGLLGLSYGVVLGAFLHMAIQIPFLIEHKLFPRLSLRVHFQSIKEVALLSIPRTLTASSNEIAEFFLISLASFMSAGSVSIFNFSFNLQSVPLSIIGVSYSLAAFPALTRSFSAGNHSEFLDQMITSAKHIIFWSIPVAVLFIVLRAQIVRVILGTGRFDWNDTRLTAASLALFAFSTISQSLMLLFVRSYYARGKTIKPLIINVLSAGSVVLFGYLLSQFFLQESLAKHFIEVLLRVDGLSGTSVLVLPLAFSIGITINMIIHWIDFQFDFPAFTKPVFQTLFQSLSASVIMGAVSYFCLNIFSNFFSLNTLSGVFLQGFLAGIIGLVVCVAVLKLLGSIELQEVWDTFHRKFWKTKEIVIEETSV